MSNSVINLSIIFVYLLIVLLIGLRAGVGRKNTVEEYVVASRSLGFWVTYFLMGGAVMSAFAFLGGPGWAYEKGAAAFFIMGYISIGIMPWWIFGVRSYRVGKKFGYVTQAELLKDRFNSKTLSALIAIVSILSFIQYVSVQMKGSAYLFEIASNGAIPFWAGGLISYLIILVYVSFGGVRGVAWTNVFQGVFMFAMAWILGISIVYSLYDSPLDMFQKLWKLDPSHLMIGTGTKLSFAAYSSAVIVSGLGFIMWPHLFMKSYTTKDEKTLKKTVLFFPTFVISLVPIFFIGFAGVSLVEPDVLGSADKILPWILVHQNYSPFLIGMTLSAVLAAAMSTQDTVTHAAGAIFYEDLVKVIGFDDLTERQSTNLIRFFVVIFGVFCYLVTVLGGQTLVALLLGAYGSVVQIFPAVFSAFFWKRATSAGVISGLLTGVVFNYLVIFDLVPKIGFDIHAGLQGLILNILVLVIVSFLSKNTDDETTKANHFISVSTGDLN